MSGLYTDRRRRAAYAAGATKYHGKPCKKGHTLRWVCNNHCVECLAVNNAERCRKYYWKDPETSRKRRMDNYFKRRALAQQKGNSDG